MELIVKLFASSIPATPSLRPLDSMICISGCDFRFLMSVTGGIYLYVLKGFFFHFTVFHGLNTLLHSHGAYISLLIHF